MKRTILEMLQMLEELNYILSKKQKHNVVLFFIIAIINSGFELLGVTAILPFMQAVLTPDVIRANVVVKKFADYFNIRTDKQLILMLGVGLILVYLLKNGYTIMATYFKCYFNLVVQKELSIYMLSMYLKRPYSYFLNVNSSEIIRGCESDISGVHIIITNIADICMEILSMAFISVYILFLDVWTALEILVLVAAVMWTMIFIFKPIVKKAGKKSIQAITQKNKAIYQTASGIKEIYVMQRKKVFIQEYEVACENARKAQNISDFLGNIPERIVEGICVSGLIGIICIRLIVNANMVEFIPKLGVFAMAAFRMLPSVGKITGRINSVVYRRPALAEVYKNIKEAREYQNGQKEKYGIGYYNIEDEGNDRWANIQFHNSIDIYNVKWKYDNQISPVLHGADVTINKGESVAFIGASGAGKTTLADIILGLLKPQQGGVKVDGIDIYGIPKKWAKIVSYVPQTVYLIDDSIRKNVCFGIPEGEIDDNKVWKALERAQLKKFIEELPDNLDTIVGERGVRLSGGQRQRIAIARALYGEPQVLVLDEATAALDQETEKAVMESIEALQGKITMIIVAHRLTTIRNCDKIYEVECGQVRLKSKEEILKNL